MRRGGLIRALAWSAALLALGSASGAWRLTGEPPHAEPVAATYAAVVRPFLTTYCLNCHSTELKKGSLDLEQFRSPAEVRLQVKTWQAVIEQLEANEMPPAKKPQPTGAEKMRVLKWIREYLDQEARRRAGDPGGVPLRRLSHAEYDYTIRDLTGVDLRPAREFPAEGAAGEGFSNAAEALTEVSPALLAKYLNAAKTVAEHAVLLPSELRFSPVKTRRDWTNESLAALQRFYANVGVGADGSIPLTPYVSATIRHRDTLRTGQMTPAQVAHAEKLNAKYLGMLWQSLNGTETSRPLDAIRHLWRSANEADAPAVAAAITQWQKTLWQAFRIGNYIRPEGSGYVESLTRQVARDPVAVRTLPLRLAVKPTPGQNQVAIYLHADELTSAEGEPLMRWRRPRFEAPGKPTLLLADYPKYRREFEVDYRSVFAGSAKYLAAAAELARDRSAQPSAVAAKHGVDAVFLERWLAVLGLTSDAAGRVVPKVALAPLDEKVESILNKVWIKGWKKRGHELPLLLTNASDTVEHIPGTALPRSVVVHPTPTEFVGVVWKSPLAGRVSVTAKITSAHPACGNGVAWWLEHRNDQRAMMFAEGAVGLGAQAAPPPRPRGVKPGDELLLAIDARNHDHGCDLTRIELTIRELDGDQRTWDLTTDIVATILTGNPHGDQHGNADTWRFALGPTRPVQAGAATVVPPGSLLDQWRALVVNDGEVAAATALAERVQMLLSGSPPSDPKDPNRILYDNLVGVESLLFDGVAPVRFGKPPAGSGDFGWPAEFREQAERGDLEVAGHRELVLRVPAGLLLGREFVVDVELASKSDRRVVQALVATAPPPRRAGWDGVSSLVGEPDGPGLRAVRQGHEEFRQLFPLFACFPAVIPSDEVVSLKMFHREDEPLRRLFLSPEQARDLDTLWDELEFISRQPVAENAYLPQFIGFVSQDGAPGTLEYFKGQQPVFARRAEEFLKREAAAEARHLDAVVRFADRAYRRPLTAAEATALRGLYQQLRQTDLPHDPAIRQVLARILVAPAFLFRIENPPPGSAPGPVADVELATRLSYFLWSSMPDAELRQRADQQKLSEPTVLAGQVRRMLQDPRCRALAIEFGTQWLHVRGFDQFQEKNEAQFPEFDAALRRDLYEEAILFFLDLFQNDRPVTTLLDADHAFLNERLAKHYGIPGVAGDHWRRVDGVKSHGRGGVLALGSVLAKQAGASRTSPILRGNWMVETLLGEKLPKPPPEVPKLPEAETAADELTMRQLVELHTKKPACATCHQRIDPFGFALERYDAIGRLRSHDLRGRAIDDTATLRTGATFTGLAGLRQYLLKEKHDVVVRLFCRRLLGFALGRTVQLSDTALLDQMVDALNRNDGRLSAAVLALVQSPQFRMIRGRDHVD
jgi:hypothetical protein